MKILLVGSDPDSRAQLARGLTELNHEVVECDSGAGAWMVFRVQAPRIVIAELPLAEMDGLELCKRIRGAKESKYAYVIMLTSEVNKVKYLDAMNAGADDVLARPCDVSDIVLRLRVAERLLQLKTKVHQLEGLLPICSYCKRIRDDHETWQPVDTFVNQHSAASFSHGVCPECYRDHIEPQLQQCSRQRTTEAH
jgi:phosphoserine phosphatase RsbU/P